MKQLHLVDTAKLDKLADFLETVPEEAFHFETWQTQAYKPSLKIGPITLREGCGFAGCAIGWAAHSKLFKGLELFVADIFTPSWIIPCYNGMQGFEAVADLFGIDYDRACFLFDPDHYPYREDEYGDQEYATADEVKTRIRRFAAKVRGRVSRYRIKQLVAKYQNETFKDFPVVLPY